MGQRNWYLLLIHSYAALNRKSKDWLARKQDNEWSDMFYLDGYFSGG